MTEQELLSYCQSNGVPYDRISIKGVEYFRVLDASKLPGAMRGDLDERGLLNGPNAESDTEEEA